MKNQKFQKYLHMSLALAGGIIISIVFFFFLFRLDVVGSMAGTFTTILMPFIYGGVIAYLLAPVCNFFQRHLNRYLKKYIPRERRLNRVTKGLAILISMLLAGATVYLLIALVLPEVMRSILSIVDSIPGTVVKWTGWIEQFIQDNQMLQNYVEQFSDVFLTNFQAWVKSSLLPNIQAIVSGVSTSVISALVVIKDALIGIIVAVYLLSSKEKFSAQGKKVVYGIFGAKKGNAVMEEIRFVDRVFGGFISGKLIDSLIIGILCFAVMSFLEPSYAMLISLVIGVTNIIPFFGPFLGAIPCGILMLMISPLQCLYFLIFILILQQFDGNILGPKILGDTTGLSSFWVLFSILLFGGMFGFVGMIIGVPTFAVFYDLITKRLKRSLRKKGLSEATEDYEKLDYIEIQKEEGSYHYRNLTEEEQG